MLANIPITQIYVGCPIVIIPLSEINLSTHYSFEKLVKYERLILFVHRILAKEKKSHTHSASLLLSVGCFMKLFTFVFLVVTMYFFTLIVCLLR